MNNEEGASSSQASAEAAMADDAGGSSGTAVSKRKNTSFKITNILPSRPPSHDPEESGDDDPDDSHTEEISEHFEHVYNAPNLVARGRFNILPCPQDEHELKDSKAEQDKAAAAEKAAQNVGGKSEVNKDPSSAHPLANTTITATAGVTAQLPNSNRHKVSLAYPPHGPKDRFKVVKIANSEPLRRGRWKVVEYPDKEKVLPTTTVQPVPPSASVVPASATYANIDPPEANSTNQQTASATSTPSLAGTEQTDAASQRNATTPALNAVRTVPNNLHSLGAMTSGQNSESLQNVVTTHHTFHGTQAVHAPLPQHIQPAHMQAPTGQPQVQQVVPTAQPQAAPQQLPQPVQPVQVQPLQVQPVQVQPVQVQPAPQQAQPPPVASNQPQQPPQQPSNHHPAVQPQKPVPTTAAVAVSSAQAAQQQQPQQPQPPQPQQPPQPAQAQQAQPQQQYVRPVDFPQVTQAQQPSQQPSQQTPRSQYQFVPAGVAAAAAAAGAAGSGTASAVNSVPPSRDPKQSMVAAAAAAQQSQVGTPTIGIQPAPPAAAQQPAAQQPPAQQQPSLAQQSSQPPQTYLESANRDSHPIASEELVERLEEISTQQGSPDTAEDPESASGTNQGAIDNRIEQAMDLVKSHLMNAVRSEVEELKEKIIKLEETISTQEDLIAKHNTDFNRAVGKLQAENDFLRNHVAPDVLVQLSNIQTTVVTTTAPVTTNAVAATQQQPQN